MLQSVFPVSGAPPTNTGAAATLIGTLLGQITGLVMAIAMFFLCYLTIINIHRVSESGQILTSAMSSMAAVRIWFAAIMMFPLSSGFSVGQAGVMQVAGWGIGMARSLYANAVKAIGPDAMVIADPIIPGTRTIVLGLMEDELCRSLINQATGVTLVPVPTATTVNSGKGALVTYVYSLAAGNATGSATCGSVSVADSSAAAATLGGVTIDMASQQKSILEGIVSSLRPQIDSIAQSYWTNKTQASLSPLLSLYQTATQSYTQQLTSAAQSVTSQLRTSLSATDARNGNLGLSKNEVQLSTLGWTSAAAYYLGFARLNGLTLSLASGTRPSICRVSRACRRLYRPTLRRFLPRRVHCSTSSRPTFRQPMASPRPAATLTR
jgi:conjugal transfer/type IV secretion protein DotA/TraY